MSYSITQQTQEIGVRLALGATPAEVLRSVVGQGMRLAGLGLALGLAGALALTRLMQSVLFEVSPIDPLTFAGVGLLLGLTALVASAVPGRRAAGVDPAIALRQQ